MSSSSKMTLTCDVCGTIQEITTYDSVNVTLNPELKPRLLEGDLSKFVCRTCSWSTAIIYPLLYHDMKKKFMVWLQTGTAEPEQTSLPLGPFMAEYTLRLVGNRSELVEKVRLFDENLDDRVFEFLKLSLRRGGPGPKEGTPGTLFFSRRALSQAGEDGFQVVQVRKEEDIIPVRTYEEVAVSLQKALPPVSEERGRWLRVNQEYAAALAAKL